LVLNDDTVKHLEETIDPNSDCSCNQGTYWSNGPNTLDLVGTAAVFDGPSGVYVYPDLMMRMRFREDATGHWFWRYANSANGRRFFMAVAAVLRGVCRNQWRQVAADAGARPPLPEQRAIATALRDVDALLSGAESVHRQRSATSSRPPFRQLLTGQIRLPGFHGEWEVKRLGDYVTFLRHGVNSRLNFYQKAG